MRNSKRILLGLLCLSLVLVVAKTVYPYVLLGYEWSGSHPRVPFYVSTSLQGNVPYDGTFEEGIQAIQNAANTWNTQGGSNFEFYYAGETGVASVAN